MLYEVVDYAFLIGCFVSINGILVPHVDDVRREDMIFLFGLMNVSLIIHRVFITGFFMGFEATRTIGHLMVSGLRN